MDVAEGAEGSDLKGRLLTLITTARAEQETFIAEASLQERAALGMPERWSAKDLLAHVGAWWGRQGRRYVLIARGEQPETFDWSDEENAQTFAANRERAWDAVVAEVAASYTTLVAAVQALSPGDLVDPTRVHAMRGQPLWRLVLGNGYLHPRRHLVGYYVQRGELDRATQVCEALTDALLQTLPMLPELQGAAHYDLACFYARIGRANEAIARLAQAFTASPELVEHAWEDHDLDAVRPLPAFQELVSR